MTAEISPYLSLNFAAAVILLSSALKFAPCSPLLFLDRSSIPPERILLPPASKIAVSGPLKKVKISEVMAALSFSGILAFG